MAESATLLRDYVASGSDDAFAQLVKDHIGLVYSAAFRVVAGDTHLARDIAQAVFTDLARKAGKLPPNVVLAGWLYRHTCFTAAKAIRTERRRQAREREAVAMQMLNEDAESIWRHITPVLDEAMNRLSARERDAILLRFFQQKPFHAIGEALGISEDAARKRVERLDLPTGFAGAPRGYGVCGCFGLGAGEQIGFGSSRRTCSIFGERFGGFRICFRGNSRLIKRLGHD